MLYKYILGILKSVKVFGTQNMTNSNAELTKNTMPLSACSYDNPLPSYSQKTPFFAKNAYFPVAKVDEFFFGNTYLADLLKSRF